MIAFIRRLAAHVHMRERGRSSRVIWGRADLPRAADRPVDVSRSDRPSRGSCERAAARAPRRRPSRRDPTGPGGELRCLRRAQGLAPAWPRGRSRGSEATLIVHPTLHRGRPSYGEASPASPTSSKERASQRRRKLMGNCKLQPPLTMVRSNLASVVPHSERRPRCAAMQPEVQEQRPRRPAQPLPASIGWRPDRATPVRLQRNAVQPAFSITS